MLLAALSFTLAPWADARALQGGATETGAAGNGDPTSGSTIELYDPGAVDEPIAETTVGMRVRLDEFVIPGSEVRAIPVEDPGRADVILRIINVFSHGNGFRYNLEVTPFVEGDVDLRDHLERVDGSSTEDLPEMVVLVDQVLDEAQLMPNGIEVPHPGSVGGYRTLLIGAGVLWVIGLLALIFVGRKKSEAALAAAARPEPSLAERLRPLVDRARRGELGTDERAALERLLLAHWRRERSLEGVGVAEAVSQLRRDDEAGPLFRALEEWLHRAPGSSDQAVDVAALLAPYENVSGAPAAQWSTSAGAVGSGV